MNSFTSEDLPVAVIGAGPVGLAAAAHLVSRGIEPLVLESGPSVGAALLDWGHVRVFSPWRYNIDPVAGQLLEDAGWLPPQPDALPTGREIVRDYLAPLAALPQIAAHLSLGAKVTAISRLGHDKMSSHGRDAAPFVLHIADGSGKRRVLARAVIDASGTWTKPNPIGIDGLPVPGERAANDLIAYGIPDVLGTSRHTYAGRRVLVVGSGHSAINAALDLLHLQDDAPETQIFWALRGNNLGRLAGGGLNDQLPERGALGLAALRALEEGRITLLAPFATESIAKSPRGLFIAARLANKPIDLDVDRIIVATGLRPDLTFLSELRVALDPAIEAPPALAPLIDPNVHSCGTVPPHGVDELAHPEKNFFIVGSKAYGRAPTFLMATGYEQVRSIVAELAGDPVAARQVQLVLPETGVCSTDFAEPASQCCGGPAPQHVDACCMLDAASKSEGKAGCGCSGQEAAPAALALAQDR